MTVEVKLFQVLNGDCIWIKLVDTGNGQTFDLLIDAGFVSTYPRTLRVCEIIILEVQVT